MKRSQQRMPRTLNRNAYPSDLTDEQWALLEPLVPALSEDGRLLRTCPARNRQWHPLRVAQRLPVAHAARIPFPAWGTVYHYFRKWQREGIWDEILRTLRMQVRRKQGRDEEPSAAIID